MTDILHDCVLIGGPGACADISQRDFITVYKLFLQWSKLRVINGRDESERFRPLFNEQACFPEKIGADNVIALYEHEHKHVLRLDELHEVPQFRENSDFK